jgi:arabinogalactan endo-1,4-beta-galactosidase
LTYIEQQGGIFKKKNVKRDCVTILKQAGFNVVRLRLYNDPGNSEYTPSKQLPAGIQNPDDILSLAKRAKDAGMKIVLTIHYSDYWTNSGKQTKPHEWENLSYDELKTAVYDFTYNFMTQMKSQGTTPEYVALGNESWDGILFPDGKIRSPGSISKLAGLSNQGYDAVKAVSADTRVIIHLDDAGNNNYYKNYFDNLDANNVKYDVIGASYYPFWTKKTVEEIITWAEYVVDRFDKDIFIMETGYNWNPVLPNGYAGQLADNGPYKDIYPSSPQGQRDFLVHLFSSLKTAAGGRILGVLYWDPVMIAVSGVGWELGGQNVVSNTTLFDFNGNALISLEAFDSANW